MFQRSTRSSQAAGVIDPMQVDAPPEENDNTEEEVYEVEIDSFVRNNHNFYEKWVLYFQ